MKYLLFLLTFFCIHLTHAQCGSGSSGSSGNSGDSGESNSGSIWRSVDSSDDDSDSDFGGVFSHIDELPNFTIGAGFHTGLVSGNIGRPMRMDDRDHSIAGTSDLWSQSGNTGYFEIMFPFRSERLVSVGAGATWNEMYSGSSNHVSFPTEEAILSAETPSDVSKLEWTTKNKFRSQTFLVQSDIEIVNIGNIVSFLGRAELGFTNYKLSTVASYTDNCGCDHSVSLNESSKISFTGGVGLGISIGFEWFEIRSTFGYRIYNQMGLQSRNTVMNTTSVIDETNYNYDGYPDQRIFSLSEPQQKEIVTSRNGVFYMQLGINIRFGDRWYW